MDQSLISAYLKQTRVLRAPKAPLSTFGATSINYHLVSPVDESNTRTRLREGKVVSEKPKILTPDSFNEIFEGFGTEAAEFSRWVTSNYGELLRALQYRFKNTDFAARVISEAPNVVSDRIQAELDGKSARDQVVISCPDAAWSLVLMKFTLDESSRSFPSNMRDLERRGMFNPNEAQDSRRRREIERLFSLASTDKSVLKPLGEKLKEYGLFAEYEDRYLAFY